MRKLILIPILILLASSLIAGGTSKMFPSVTGTTDTSDVWVEAVTIDNSRYGLSNILIINTGTSSNDMSWRVCGYVHPDSPYYYIIATGTDLSDYSTADDVELIEELPSGFPYVTVDVKTTVADSTTGYQIDYCIKNAY